jgi:hypothetical protein
MMKACFTLLTAEAIHNILQVKNLILIPDYSKFRVRAQVRLQFPCILNDGVSMEYKKIYETCIGSEIISASL